MVVVDASRSESPKKKLKKGKRMVKKVRRVKRIVEGGVEQEVEEHLDDEDELNVSAATPLESALASPLLPAPVPENVVIEATSPPVKKTKKVLRKVVKKKERSPSPHHHGHMEKKRKVRKVRKVITTVSRRSLMQRKAEEEGRTFDEKEAEAMGINLDEMVGGSLMSRQILVLMFLFSQVVDPNVAPEFIPVNPGDDDKDGDFTDQSYSDRDDISPRETHEQLAKVQAIRYTYRVFLTRQSPHRVTTSPTILMIAHSLSSSSTCTDSIQTSHRKNHQSTRREWSASRLLCVFGVSISLSLCIYTPDLQCQ